MAEFLMTEQKVLKSTLPCSSFILGLEIFYHIYLVLVQCTFLFRQKATLELPFLFPTGLHPFSKFASDIRYGLPYFVTDYGGKTVYIPWRSASHRGRRCSSDFGCQMLMKSFKKSSIIFRNVLLFPFYHLFVSGMWLITFSSIICLSIGWSGRVPTGELIWCPVTDLAVSIAAKK